MATPTVTISQLSAGDLPEAAAVLDAAFNRMGMIAGLRRVFELQPDGLLCAWRDGRIVGVVGAYDYGPFASIGMMAVHPAAQRQGVAARLMTELEAYLDARGCPLSFLDASVEGQPLYPKLGFVAEGETLRMRRAEPFAPASPLRPFAGGRREGLVVSRLKEPDLAQVAAFDAPLFGADRTSVIRTYCAGSSGRAFDARDAGGRLAGYLIADAGHIGPWTARSPDAAAALLDAALALPFDGPVTLTCPAANRGALLLLERIGFAVTERLLHMRRGGTADPRQTGFLYAQASLTLG
jgi:ribosomal protein S18 acetylase RimI-like enzyme